MGDAERVTVTRTQARIAEALADPNLKTMRQVADAVGVHQSSVYDARRNPRVVAKQTQIESERIRASRGYRALGDTLIRSGVSQSDKLDPIEKIQSGGALVKLGHEVDDSPLGGTPADVDAYSRAIQKAVMLGARVQTRGRLERALRLLRTPQHLVVRAVSQLQLRQHNHTESAETIDVSVVASE